MELLKSLLNVTYFLPRMCTHVHTPRPPSNTLTCTQISCNGLCRPAHPSPESQGSQIRNPVLALETHWVPSTTLQINSHLHPPIQPRKRIVPGSHWTHRAPWTIALRHFLDLTSVQRTDTHSAAFCSRAEPPRLSRTSEHLGTRTRLEILHFK